MKSLLRVGLFVVSLSCGLLLVSHLILELSSTSGRGQVIPPYLWALRVWRYGLYALVLLVWPSLIDWVGRRQQWPPETVAYWSHQRMKLLGLLVLIEVFLVDNGLGQFIAWLSSSS